MLGNQGEFADVDGQTVTLINVRSHQRVHGEAHPERRIHWCPVGQLVFVPFHAAGITQGPDCEGCYDYVVSSYTPSLSMLLRARKNTGQPRSFQSLRMLAVASSGRGAKLSHVDKEITIAAKYARAVTVDVTELSSDDATRQRVLDELPGADIVHIAAHGHQNPGAPLESWFSLRDNDLTIKDIMSLDLPGTCLAFLSACETVMGAHRQPDQAIHLGATFLFCGFASVIGTMWFVHSAEYEGAQY
jgi:CHAT domain-containing protein